MNEYRVYAQAQIITKNPIRLKPEETQCQYYTYLKRLLHLAKLDRGKYVKAILAFYKKILTDSKNVIFSPNKQNLIRPFCYLIPFDIISILGFRKKESLPKNLIHIANTIIRDFNLPPESNQLLKLGFEAAKGNMKAWESFMQDEALKPYIDYLSLVQDNIVFSNRTPYGILITATMSAGKSTLINALTGKNISLTQNMACTSKIHTIVSKPFEDGITTEYDYDLSIDASKEDLLTDNNNNKSAQIVVGTHFSGGLGGHRIEVHDSPGVNSSEHTEHAEITRQLLKSKGYELLLYVINSTQLTTTDEVEHLNFISKEIGNRKLIFVMNKIDHLIAENESIPNIIARQRDFLQQQGFDSPIIFPVSAYAACLAKKSMNGPLGRLEQRELNNFIDKFSSFSLSDYYENELGCPHIPAGESEVDTLFRDCGFAYLEREIVDCQECAPTSICMRMKGNVPSSKLSSVVNAAEKKAHKNLVRNVCPVYVIATEGSGKSTLINSLLQKNLMPAKNGPCTATITEIIDTDDDSFTAVAYNKSNVMIRDVSGLSHEVMSKLYEDEEVHRIFVRGRIPVLDPNGPALALIDTPGFAGPCNQEYKNTICRVLQSDSNSLLLYVLNATNYGLDDNTGLLKYVAEQIKNGGKQIRDRFLFVINKMDQFKPQEGENIEKAIASVRKYLSGFGIEGPQLFPCSAYTALNIRTYLTGIDIDNLTRQEERALPATARDTLPLIDKFIEFYTMHLEKYSTLSPSAQQELNYRLSQAIERGDTKELALIHSGICSIKAAIRDYVENTLSGSASSLKTAATNP